MKILIDNGHGIDTKGKRSPDGRLLVPEETDISLPERCRRVNEWCCQQGKDNVLLISIHCNAAGRGNTRADGTQFGRRAPNPAFHNIIQSELC